MTAAMHHPAPLFHPGSDAAGHAAETIHNPLQGVMP